jgi:hypothetical protein
MPRNKPKAWRRTIVIRLPEELDEWIMSGMVLGVRRYFKHRDSGVIDFSDDNDEISRQAMEFLEKLSECIGEVLGEHGGET